MSDYDKRLTAIHGMLEDLFHAMDTEAEELEAEQADYEDDLNNFDPDEEGAIEPEDPGHTERIEELRSALDELSNVIGLIEEITLP